MVRVALSFLILTVVIGAAAWSFVKPIEFLATGADEIRSSRVASMPRTAKPNFDSDIKPIFQARCQPCHFQGGKVYDKLPFDKPETIIKLGTKLFTRIKDEKEQQKIREFLDQP